MNIQPPSILLMGPSGGGKTYSISTLLEAGLEVFVLITEPHGIDTLLDTVEKRKLDINKLHWKYVGPARSGFSKLVTQGTLISKVTQKALADQQPGVRDNPAWVQMLTCLTNFKDDKDGKEYGDAGLFGPDRALVVDSLSGVSAMAMDNVIGDKVTANVGEWGVAIRQLDGFLLTCTSDLKCFFVMTAHIEKEEDPITGIGRIMVSTLGKKLAPTIPRYFSEVLLADSETKGSERTWFWSNNTPNHVLKNRSLPIGSNLDPSFKPIVEAYKKRLEMVKAA